MMAGTFMDRMDNIGMDDMGNIIVHSNHGLNTAIGKKIPIPRTDKSSKTA